MATPDTFPFGGSGSGAPSGAADGDLAGTYPNPTVAKATNGIVVGSSALTNQYAAQILNSWAAESVVIIQNLAASGNSGLDARMDTFATTGGGLTHAIWNSGAGFKSGWANFAAFNGNTHQNAPSIAIEQFGSTLVGGTWYTAANARLFFDGPAGDMNFYKFNPPAVNGNNLAGYTAAGLALQIRGDNARIATGLGMVVHSDGDTTVALPSGVDLLAPVIRGNVFQLSTDVVWARTGLGPQLSNSIGAGASSLIVGDSTASNVDKTAALGCIDKGGTNRINLFKFYTDYTGGQSGFQFGHGGVSVPFYYDFEVGVSGNVFRVAANGISVNNGQTIKKVLSATATLDFPSTSLASSNDLTVTVTGAAVGDPVFLGVPNGSVNANSDFFAWVSAADTVKVRFSNYSALSIDPASGAFRVCLFQF